VPNLATARAELRARRAARAEAPRASASRRPPAAPPAAPGPAGANGAEEAPGSAAAEALDPEPLPAADSRPDPDADSRPQEDGPGVHPPGAPSGDPALLDLAECGPADGRAGGAAAATAQPLAPAVRGQAWLKHELPGHELQARRLRDRGSSYRESDSCVNTPACSRRRVHRQQNLELGIWRRGVLQPPVNW
jgi:hypothetical protein